MFFAPLWHIEAGAGFGGILVVARYAGNGGEFGAETLDKEDECFFLQGVEGVFGLALGIKPAYIADAYGAGVTAVGVRSCLFQRAAFVYRPIKVDEEVVRYIGIALTYVPPAHLFNGGGAVFGSGGAVEDNFVNRSHNNRFCR